MADIENITPNNAPNNALSALFALSAQFRHAETADAIAPALLERVSGFVPYETALFWFVAAGGTLGDMSVSGDGVAGSAEMGAAEALARHFVKETQAQIFSLYDFIDAPEEESPLPSFAPEGVFVPLFYRGELYGGFVLLRQASWSDAALTMLRQCGEQAAYSLAAMQMGVHGARAVRGTWRQWLLLFGFGALFFAGVLLGGNLI